MKLPGRGISWKQFLIDLKNEWNHDALSDVAGSVTYFAILALFPFLLFLVSLASLFIDPQSAAQLIDSIRHAAPQAVTEILSSRIRSLATQRSVGLLTIGAVTAIWSASGGVRSLMRALNTCYGVRERRPFWKTYGIALAMTLVGAAISILAAAAAIVLPPILSALGGEWGSVVIWLRMPAAALLMMFLWAVIYYFLPDVEQQFKFITPGSVVGVLLWLIASYGFSIYVSHFSKYEVTYGAIGGVIILLLWMWISVLTLLLGAEINVIIEHRSPEGKLTGARTLAETGEDVPKAQKAGKVKPPPPVVVRPEPHPGLRGVARNAALLWLLRVFFRRRST